MAAVDKLLADLVDKYRAGPAPGSTGHNSGSTGLGSPGGADTVALELEIRFQDLTRETFEQIYQAVVKDEGYSSPRLETTVNIISDNIYESSTGARNDNTQYIRRIVFNNGVATSDTYHTKERIGRSVMVPAYVKHTVSLARETDRASKFGASAGALVRFKVRMSFDINEGGANPKWRMDFTMTRQGKLATLGAAGLKKVRDELFIPLTPATFISATNHESVDGYELEIECMDKNITVADLAVVKKVFAVVNPAYATEAAYQDTVHTIAGYILPSALVDNFKQPTYRLKQLGNQVQALSKNIYYADIFPPIGYLATIKTNGQRALILIDGGHALVVKSDTLLEYGTIGASSAGDITVVDVEQLVVGDLTTYYIFDVMVIRGENVSTRGLVQRKDLIPDAVSIALPILSSAGSGVTCLAKKYVTLGENLEAGYREVWADESAPRDGIIISSPGDSYYETKNYKWKPYEHNTIDFLAVKCPPKLLGIRPYDVRPGLTLYLLFVGVNHTMREKLGLGFIPYYKQLFPTPGNYYPIQFSPSANPLAYLYWHDADKDIDRQIIELARNADGSEWAFYGMRPDRKLEKNYFGNDFRVAELTYLNYIDPFGFEELWSKSSAYFTKTATDIYAPSNRFKRFVISLLMKDNLSGSRWIIDEAAGRGGDLHRYQEIGVENALFIDIDASAIAELIRRKFSFFAAKKRHVRGWMQGDKAGGDDASSLVAVTNYDRVHGIEYDKLIVKDVKSLTVHTLVADLRTPYADLAAMTYQFGINPGLVDGIVCNFALHYLCGSLEDMRNVLLFNAKMLKVGGVFIFTVMDGKAIFELLKDLAPGQQWASRENGALKYAITRKFTGKTLAPCGQMISVLLPFSDEMYDEPICNVDAVIAEARKLGFEIELNSPMTSYIDKFARADPTLAGRLTADDKKYIALHRYVSLRKVKATTK